MCIKKILSIFRRTNVPTPTPEPIPQPAPIALIIPHPEEAPDYSKTIANADLNAALDEWTINYSVPENCRAYWKTKIAVTLDANLPYPAATYELGGIRHLTIRPEWVNSGVIAHEQAHNSYALLTEKQKIEFSAVYTSLKATDPLILFLYSKNSYGLANDIEGHAEIYRYLGEGMPEALKKYYPKLF
jgi:hypothetical protein